MAITAEEAAAAGLSQAEIDAINNDGAIDPRDEAILNEIAGDGDEGGEGSDDGQPGDEGNDDGAAAADDSGTAAGDDAAGDAGTVAASPDDPFAVTDELPAVNFVPQLTGELLPEFAKAEGQAYAAADERRAALEAKFEAGEIDEAQLKGDQRKIDQELNAEIRKINAANTNTEIQSQRWAAEQTAFFAKYGVYAATPILFNALNAEVIRLANLPESAGKTGLQVLMAAKASVDKQLQAFTGGAVQNTKGKDGKAAATPKPRATMPDVKTLAGVPAAAAADVGKGRFAHLDNLTGLELEAAVARLSDADRAAYLAES